MLNDYSKSDAFNSDKSYYLIRADSGYWYIYQTSDHSVVRGPAAGLAGENEPEWHVSDPDKLYWMDNNGGLILRQYSVTSNSSTVVKDFTASVQALFGGTAARLSMGNEGRPSTDQRYWGWLVMTNGFDSLGLMVWDKQADSIIGSKTLGSGLQPNWVGMSPSGSYFIAAWVGETIDGQPGRVRAYTNTFSDWTWVSCWIQHDDVLKLANGNDGYVSAQTSSCDPDGLYYYVDLTTDWVSQNYATRHKLSYGVYSDGAYNSYHINGTATGLPGTFVVSTAECRFGTCPNSYSDRLIRFNTDNTAPVVLAKTNNTYVGYWTEVFGASSKDGSKVIWGGNWCASSCADTPEAFIVDVPVSFTITTTTMPNGTNGQAYQADAQTSGGTQPPTACITSAGSVPAGATWSVSGNACRLSDASAETGTYNFTLQATDSNSNTDTQAFTLTIVAALQIDTASPMPDGTLSAGYSEQLVCSGGTPPRTFSCCQSGALPTGLTLASNGTFTGTFEQTGVYNFTARCTDNVAATADKALQITVGGGGALTMRAPIIMAGHSYAVFTVGAVGLDYTADCQAIVKDSGGATVETVTSTSGPAVRRLATSVALTAASTYSATFTCSGATPDMTPYPFVTLAAPVGGARTVPLVFGAPSSVLSGAARLTVEYDDNEALSSPATQQNTSCGSGCTVNLSLTAGLYYYRWKWQTAADVVLATSTIQALPVP